MRLPSAEKTLRVIGFDDAPFVKRPGAKVPIVGVVCAGTRFEGMVWGKVRRDGWGANATLCSLLEGKKFLPQVHVVLLDGLAFGGFNVVDLPTLAARLDRPCIAVMRKMPDLRAIEHALRRLPRPALRLARFQAAGEIHHSGPFFYQVAGAEPQAAADVLGRLTDRGHVPEALRLAHLIGSAVIQGESGRRA